MDDCCIQESIKVVYGKHPKCCNRRVPATVTAYGRQYLRSGPKCASISGMEWPHIVPVVLCKCANAECNVVENVVNVSVERDEV